MESDCFHEKGADAGRGGLLHNVVFFLFDPLRLYVTIDYSVVSDYCTIESYCGGDLPLTECLLGA